MITIGKKISETISLSNLAAIFVTVCYITGFIITNTFLSKFSFPISFFFSTQYFVVGIICFVPIIFAFILAELNALIIEKYNIDAGTYRKSIFVLFTFILICLNCLFSFIITSEFFNLVCLSPVIIYAFLVLTNYFINNGNDAVNYKRAIQAFKSIFLIFTFLTLPFVYIYAYTDYFFPRIPHTWAGGKHQPVIVKFKESQNYLGGYDKILKIDLEYNIGEYYIFTHKEMDVNIVIHKSDLIYIIPEKTQ